MRSVYLPSRMTVAEKRTLVTQMTDYAANLIDESDPGEPATWRVALRRIGCGVTPWPDANDDEVAQFIPIADMCRGYPLGLVRYNVDRKYRTRAKGLAHEFGHALLYKWVPIMIYDADVVFSYHDDPRSVRHQIARQFERVMVK